MKIVSSREAMYFPLLKKERLYGNGYSYTQGETINWQRLSGELSDEPSLFYKALADGGKYKITSKQRILILNVK